MNDMTIYWIWLQMCLGEGARAEEIVAYFENPKEIYISGDDARWQSGTFTIKQLERLKKFTLSDAERVITECEKLGCGIVTPDSDKYPPLLRCISDYPLVLYTMGNLDCMKNKAAISMVGTRRASEQGLEIAGKLAASLSRAGVVVVSGGAYGIDSASHLGVLNEGGVTVAVIGCGFLSHYRDGITDLKQDIMEKGAVISEYSPSKDVQSFHFPVRNRIISALSLGTVVVEASAKSGSLITARLASEQGRDVFAVPGNAASLMHMGTVGLIRDGAIPVFSAVDILGTYSLSHPDFIAWDKVETDLLYSNGEKIDFSSVKYGVKKYFGGKNEIPNEEYLSEIPSPASPDTTNVSVKRKKPEFLRLSEEAEKVYSVFGNESIHVDEIGRKTGLPLSKVLAALTELEILGIIKNQPGKRYIAK